MSWNLIAHTAAGDSAVTSVTTMGINTTGADFIALACTWYSGIATGVDFSDNKGNTPYIRRTIYSEGGGDNNSVVIAYFQAPAVGTGHTFTATANPSSAFFPSLFAQAFSGSASSPYDTENGAGTVSGATSQQPGSITPVQTGELLISAIVVGAAAASLGINDSFSITDTLVAPGAPGSMAWLSDGNANAINPTWSWTNATSSAAALAAFKGAGAGFNAGWAYGATKTIMGVFQ